MRELNTATIPSERESIASLEKQTAEALLSADTAALDKIWVEDFTFTAPNGMMLTKSAYLSKLRAHELEYETLAPVRIAVRLYGETALVSGNAIVKARAGDQNISSGIESYLTVYMKRDGTWRQVATQATRVTK